MKTTKKVLSVLLAVLMAMSMLAVSVSAGNTAELSLGKNSVSSGNYVFKAMLDGVYEIKYYFEVEDDNSYYEATLTNLEPDYTMFSPDSEDSIELYRLDAGTELFFEFETESSSFKADIAYKGEILAFTPDSLALQLGRDVYSYDWEEGEYLHIFYDCVNMTTLLGATYKLNWFEIWSDKALQSGVNIIDVSDCGKSLALTVNIYKVTDFVKDVKLEDTDNIGCSIGLGGFAINQTYPDALTVDLGGKTVEAKYDEDTGYYDFEVSGLKISLSAYYRVNDDYSVDFVVEDGNENELASKAVELDSLSVFFGKLAKITDLFDSIIETFIEFIYSIFSFI